MPTYEVTITAKVIIQAENVVQAHLLAQSEDVRVIGTVSGVKGKTRKDRNRYRYRRTVIEQTKSLPILINP